MEYNNKTPQQFYDELQVDDLVKVLYRDVDSNELTATKWYDCIVTSLKALNNKPARVVKINDKRKIIVWPRQLNTHIQHR